MRPASYVAKAPALVMDDEERDYRGLAGRQMMPKFCYALCISRDCHIYIPLIAAWQVEVQVVLYLFAR